MDQKIKRVAERILGDFIPMPEIIEMSQNGMELIGVFKSGARKFDFIINPHAKYPLQYKPKLDKDK